MTADPAERIQMLTAGGRVLRVATRDGNPGRPPLLLCNGIGGRLELFQSFVDTLDPRRGIIRFDMPGIGASPAPVVPYHLATLAPMLTGLLARPARSHRAAQRPGSRQGSRRGRRAGRRGAAASYGISKAAVLALTATVAAELDGTPVIVNAVDPDLTATWPGAQAMGARPVSASVPGIVWAATLPDDEPRGGFFRDGRPHPW